ncbi:hypothetical protein ACF0H5_002472 [Mactra antiquata]
METIAKVFMGCKLRKKFVVKILVLTLSMSLLYVTITYYNGNGLHSPTDRLGPLFNVLKSGYHLDNIQAFSAVSDEEKYELMNNIRDSVDSVLKKCNAGKSLCKENLQGSKLLTLFTTWVYDEDKFPINYKTMINWKTLLSNANLIVFSNSSEVQHHSELAGFTILPVTHEADGSPVLPTMFKAAKKKFQSQFYGFANADILFNDSLMKTLSSLVCNLNSSYIQNGLLIVGRRINVPAMNVTGQDAISSSSLARISKSSGSLFQTDAEDYFITDMNYNWNNFLPVVIGRRGYDNWVVAYSRYNNITVMDATESILCIHQTIQSRGNYEGLSKGDYNIDLIEKKKMPFSFAAWGRTWCSDLKTWFDLCGQVIISVRSKVNTGCTSLYWYHNLLNFLGFG